jgi:transcription antitermination factor NusG
MNNSAPWYALQTMPRSEKKVEYLLSQKSYKCLLPTYRQKRQWSDRTVEVELPLFPMYVFCQFSHSAVGKAIATPGVSRIVGFGGRPVEVAPKEIEALQLLAQSHLLREPWTYLPDGTLVKVETGPLTGMSGIICSSEDKRRLVISVTLLQRSVAVQLGEDTVVSVIEGPKDNKSVFNNESDLALKLTRTKSQGF